MKPCDCGNCRALQPKTRRPFWVAFGILIGILAALPDVRAQVITGASAVNVSQWLGSSLPTVGQKAMASSIPVVIASDQGNIPHNEAQINGVTPLMGNGTTGTGSQRVTIASDNTAFSVNAAQSGTWNVGTVTTLTGITNALPAGGNLIGLTAPSNGCGTTKYESALQMLPAASTSLTATTTCVTYILLNNTDSVAHPITIQDQTTACNAAPCQILSAYSLPANSATLLPMWGAKLSSGIKWNTDAANKVVADVVGLQ